MYEFENDKTRLARIVGEYERIKRLLKELDEKAWQSDKQVVETGRKLSHVSGVEAELLRR